MGKKLLTEADARRVAEVLASRHGSGLKNETFAVTARIEGDAVIGAFTLSNSDRTFVYTMEAAIVRTEYVAMSETDALDVAFDFLDWYLGEFFREERELLLPLDWKPHQFGDVRVMARGELRNAFLDEAADAWLKGERPDIESAYKLLKRREKGGDSLH